MGSADPELAEQRIPGGSPSGQRTVVVLSESSESGLDLAQEAPWLELLTRMDLCGCCGSTAGDRRRLVARLDELPEATGTLAYARACALLEGTKPS